MPELPEVEAARKLIETNCVGVVIASVNTLEQGNGPRHGLFDDIVLDVTSVQDDIAIESTSYSQSDFENALISRRIISVHRKGKQIWIELEGEGPSMLFHFGMTGSFCIRGVESATYKSFKVQDDNWPPKFCKLEIIFGNGVQLAFCDPRRLGRIRIRHGDPKLSPPISKLARDPLVDGLSVDYLQSCLSKYNCNIKQHINVLTEYILKLINQYHYAENV